MHIQKLKESLTWGRVLWIIGGIIVIFGAFKMGELTGFEKAKYSFQWGEGYYRNFMGPERGKGMMNRTLNDGSFLMGHGISGQILKISGSTLMVQDRDGAEKTITITSSTQVRMFRDPAPFTSLKIGGRVMIIGTPSKNGIIDARLIRIIPEFDESLFPKSEQIQ